MVKLKPERILNIYTECKREDCILWPQIPIMTAAWLPSFIHSRPTRSAVLFTWYANTQILIKEFLPLESYRISSLLSRKGLRHVEVKSLKVPSKYVPEVRSRLRWEAVGYLAPKMYTHKHNKKTCSASLFHNFLYSMSFMVLIEMSVHQRLHRSLVASFSEKNRENLHSSRQVQLSFVTISLKSFLILQFT